MYIIAGLGNPGREYEHTRHNCGFDCIDELADLLGVAVVKHEHRAITGAGYIEGEKVLLVKPQTYMNKSGESLAELLGFYKLDPARSLIVLYDDIDLEPGQLRVRGSGSAGGHNGMKDIIKNLGTQEFARVRIGVGAKPPQWDLADHVLGHFSPEDRQKMDESIEQAARTVITIVTEGITPAMNRVNRKKSKKDGETKESSCES